MCTSTNSTVTSQRNLSLNESALPRTVQVHEGMALSHTEQRQRNISAGEGPPFLCSASAELSLVPLKIVQNPNTEGQIV